MGGWWWNFSVSQTVAAKEKLKNRGSASELITHFFPLGLSLPPVRIHTSGPLNSCPQLHPQFIMGLGILDDHHLEHVPGNKLAFRPLLVS